MNKSLVIRLMNLLSRRQLKDRLARVAMMLSCAAVFCVTYMLVAPVLTQEWPAVCGLEEHTHTDECYIIELREIPMESQPEAEPQPEGHVHDDDCYEERTTRELTCTLTETEGHAHGDGCWETSTTLTCGEDENEEHTHSDGCYDTETVLVCGEAEDGGHTHDESCYEEITVRELVCDLEETCETEEPAEAEPLYEEVRVLACEQEEHIHEDLCYRQESNETRYYCGLDEHTHTDSCYFESGDLRCTVPQHSHTEDCLTRQTAETPEVTGMPEINAETVCGLQEHMHSDGCYTLDEVTGEPVLTCDESEHTHTDECLAQAQPETHPEVVELSETFTAESEDGAVILTLQVNGQVYLPETEAAGEAPESEEPAETQEAGFQLLLTESEDWDAYDEYTELASEEGEVLVVGVLDYVLTYNGQPVDLTECQVTAEVTPTEAFRQFMDAPETMGLMTLDMTDETGETDADESMETHFTAYTEQRGRVAYSVTLGANVVFYVQYYAYMERLVIADGTGTPLDVIDTDNGGTGAGGRLPKNGEPQATKTGETGKTPIRNIYIGADGKVETKSTLTEIYKRGENGAYDPQKGSKFEYFDAPGLQYFNMMSNVADIQYSINQVWIQRDGEGDPTSLNAADWLVLPYEEDVTRFTNRPETAASNPNYILLQQNDVIRLIYSPKSKNEIFPADFYDYDISDGTSAQNATSMTTRSGDVNTGTNYGINSGSIPYGTARFGFGNKNTGTSTALSGGTWQNNGVTNIINAANASGSWKEGYTDTSYARCVFNLVSGMNETGTDVVFSDGIVGPSLFGAREATGKTQIQKVDQIQFKRVGDTYTLAQIPGTGATDLDTFRHPGIYDGEKAKSMWSNDFWPMDNIYGATETGHDIMYGGGTAAQNPNGTWAYVANGKKRTDGVALTVSDDGLDHNSFFGMNFAVEFELTKNYIGPLEYYFFGDDDMWAFLSEVREVKDANGDPVIDPVTGKVKTEIIPGSTSQKIVDIGGVHSAVGQYVNLWDYISTGSWDDNERRNYRLTFFYTERGAGGSTCWMQFTLPTVVGVDLETQIKDLIKEDTGTIRIEKQMGGIESSEPFQFKLDLEGADNYKIQYLHRDPDGQITTSDRDGGDAIGDNGLFVLEPGEIMVIHNLPKNTRYTITEVKEFKQGYHTEIHTVVGEAATETVEKFGADVAAVTTGTVTPGQLTWVTFINSATYELPATGGSGTAVWYTMGVLFLLGAAFLMYKNRTQKEDGICQ